MASLTALPIELKDFIFEHLSTPHLLNLSATCKHLHALALPLAYRNLTLTWTNEPLGAARNPKLLILVRPFNQNPDLELVRHLCLRAKGCTHYTNNGELRTSIPGNEQPYNLGPTMGWIIEHCVNLESLELCSSFCSESTWFEDEIQNNWHSRPQWMSALKRVRLACDMDRDDWIPDSLVSGQETLRLFNLPSVETIELEHFCPLENFASNSWLLGSPPAAQHLTTLRIGRSSAKASLLGLVLMQTPHLRIFELDCLYHLKRRPFDLDELKTGLDRVQATLERLEIRYELYFDEDHCENVIDLDYVTSGTMGSFRRYQHLKQLEISLHVLFGSGNSLGGVFSPLSAVLPPNLEDLVITDDLYMFNEFQQYFEDEAAMAIFKKYLTGGDWDGQTWVSGAEEGEWKIATPNLKRFVYDLRERGDWTHGYWSQKSIRKELRQLCEKQGIKSKVLWY